MADFKTHMSVSTATGALLALAGYQAKIPLDTCVVAGTLCSVSGMLPDLDSNSGRPLREATAMGAAVIPMLLADRLQRLDVAHDTMVLIAILTYVAIRFVLAEVFRRYTVHRGMWHSIPAAAICGCFAFMIMSNEDITLRLFKTSGVVLGFLSHLILDEVWSVDFKKGNYKFKESFGTALKLWGNNRAANIFTYSKLAIIGLAVWQDQGFMSRYHLNPNVPHTVSEMIASLKQRFQQAADAVDERLKGELGQSPDGAAGLAQGSQASAGLPAPVPGSLGNNFGAFTTGTPSGSFSGSPVSTTPNNVNPQGLGGNTPPPLPDWK
jgi:membrane-bound metal-dependent hydrolase YbcI (DUF457 family)